MALDEDRRQAPENARMAYTSGSLRLELCADAGKLGVPTATPRNSYQAMFVEADANTDGKLESGELALPKAAVLRSVLAVADQNADGTLGEAEFVAWLEPQDQIARGMSC